MVGSIAIDLLIHLGCGVAFLWAALNLPGFELSAYIALLWAVVVVNGMSFVDRVFFQWAFGTTPGKALFGLCTIRTDTGGRPTLWQLIKQWFSWVTEVVAYPGQLLSS